MTRLFHLRPATVRPDAAPQHSGSYATTEAEAVDVDGISELIGASAAEFRWSSEALAFGLVLGAELGRTYPELAPTMIEDVFERTLLPDPRPFVDRLVRLSKRSDQQARAQEQTSRSSRVHERLAQVEILRRSVG
jgi:hypothetical protein